MRCPERSDKRPGAGDHKAHAYGARARKSIANAATSTNPATIQTHGGGGGGSKRVGRSSSSRLRGTGSPRWNLMGASVGVGALGVALARFMAGARRAGAFVHRHLRRRRCMQDRLRAVDLF